MKHSFRLHMHVNTVNTVTIYMEGFNTFSLCYLKTIILLKSDDLAPQKTENIKAYYNAVAYSTKSNCPTVCLAHNS